MMMLAMASFAQSNSMKPGEWCPTGVWPFLNQRFDVATVYTGFVNVTKTQVPCNIHIGNQTLWYAKDDTLMEANPGSVLRVEFRDGTYIPINQSLFGKIVKEDEAGKVIRVREVDQKEMEERAKSASNLGIFLLDGPSMLTQSIDLMGQYVAKPEEQPLPVKDTFYYLFKGQLFEANETNILAHIDPARKREYRAYTRSAEIISYNESSIIKQWNDFFVNYSTPLKKKK